MKYLIVNSVEDVHSLNRNAILFIHTKVDGELYIKLLTLSMNYKLIILKKISQKFQIDSDDINIEKILKGGDYVTNNYYQIDLLNNSLNNYLQIAKSNYKRTHLQVEVEQKRLVHNQTNSEAYLPLIEKELVINYHRSLTPTLNADVNFFHKYINAKTICLTTDKQLYFKATNYLKTDAFKISSSNSIVTYKYFYLPKCSGYKSSKKVVLVKLEDLQFITKNLLNGEYTLIFTDDLENSSYFLKQCSQFNIETSNQVNTQSLLYEGQDTISLGIINLVEKHNNIDLYEVQNELSYIAPVRKKTSSYQFFLLDYKHSLVNKFENNCNLDLLRQ